MIGGLSCQHLGGLSWTAQNVTSTKQFGIQLLLAARGARVAVRWKFYDIFFKKMRCSVSLASRNYFFQRRTDWITSNHFRYEDCCILAAGCAWTEAAQIGRGLREAVALVWMVCTIARLDDGKA